MSDPVNIKAYPFPNEKEGYSSRFVVGFTDEEKGKDGQEVTPPTEIVITATFEYKVHDFEYNKAKDSWDFKPTGSKAKDSILPYIPTPELSNLVRLMQIVKRPVLLKGEPGSGKTKLAKAVAYEWYGSDYRQHYFEWHIKSNSKALDGLYDFDHVARLRDTQRKSLQQANQSSTKEEEEEDLRSYRKLGSLAKAFLTSAKDSPSILLIDEIDKANIDFANDLLLELDEMRFKIPETGEEIKAAYPPLVFITSNDERELPEAFLRRCLFMYIKFPGDDFLKRIIGAHLPELMVNLSRREFVDRAIGDFRALKDRSEKDPNDGKRISTSELIDWLTGYRHKLLGKKKSELRKIEKELLQEDLDLLAPFYQAVLKTQAAIIREIEKKSDV